MSEKCIKLVLNEREVTNENGCSYIGYGFTAYRESDDAEVFKIEDLSVERGEVEKLITLIVDNDVSVTHFEELIEDFCG